MIVVADSSKLGRVHLARIAGLDQVDELITDANAAPEELARLRRVCTVTVAPPRGCGPCIKIRRLARHGVL